MDNAGWIVLIMFILILINGFFSMSEIALVSARKVRLQQRAEDGDEAAKHALKLTETPNRLLSTVQVGITTVGMVTGVIGGASLSDDLAALLSRIPNLSESAAGGIAVALVVLVTTYFSLVLGELIPKRLGMNNPEKISLAVAGLMRALAWITTPVINLLSASTDLGLRILGVKKSQELPITEEEIKVLMEQGTQVGVFEEVEQVMVESVLRLSDRFVDAVMTPRTEIEWIDLDQTETEILAQIKNSPHSRFPAAHGSLDAVEGVLMAKDMLNSQLSGQPLDFNALLRKPLFVPDSTSAMDLLQDFKETGLHMALIIDEFGGLMGMVTLYDILEAIVGQMPDSSQQEEPEIILRDDGTYLLDGLLPVDEVKELLDLDDLPDESRIGFQTLGGFVMAQVGAVPHSGLWFEWGGYRFEVMDMDGKRVDKVLVSHTPPIDSDGGGI